MAAKHVTTEAFDQDVLKSEQPTLVDFYADWCGPCRTMGSVVNELADELQGDANIVKVNIDESPELASRYGVESIPTFVVIRNGEATNKLVGVQPKTSLANALVG